MAIYHLLLLEELKGYHLTFSHARVIHQLKIKEPRTSAEIIEKLEISASSLSGMLDRLEQMGMILRKRDKKDRRIIWICLSERSKKMIEEISNSQTRKISKHLEKIHLTPEEIDVLIEKLHLLVESFYLPSKKERRPEA
ncbi:MarR family winged helix-turn-helix transcriptional regulator [Thermoactinomyces mirandus]|uniref:MarR family winged helix-turn-helix transcriptional regulator n=1 Tax=Thermoactinomyces mirandus TaxID=2756294 RepID=UPI0015EF4CE2|nr:MarR family transcriptional regulator [Thermoactinomyces mirandus]